MYGVAVRSIGDLMAATGAVGDNNRFRIRGANGGQQIGFGHFQGYIKGFRLIAKRPGTAATAGSAEIGAVPSIGTIGDCLR